MAHALHAGSGINIPLSLSRTVRSPSAGLALQNEHHCTANWLVGINLYVLTIYYSGPAIFPETEGVLNGLPGIAGVESIDLDL